LHEDEFDGRIEADIAVDDLAALVDDEECGNRVDAIELSGLAFSDRARREKAASFHMGHVNINFPTGPFNPPHQLVVRINHLMLRRTFCYLQRIF
jgi:hypothetical protein